MTEQFRLSRRTYVECDNCVDGVGELRDEKEAKDGIKDLFVGNVHGPVAIEDRVTENINVSVQL